MQKINHFIDINPAAEADILSMNVLIKADENYINGVEFTHSEIMGDGSVKFFYCCPDELTPEQELNADRLVKSVYDDFMASRAASESDQDYNYAHYTFMTGTRAFLGVEMILSNMIDNFDEVTSHSCGSFSTTNNLIARNAISDTAIVMSYSLLEGFFHEEFDCHLKNNKDRRPKELSGLIGKLLHEHNITLEDWKNRRKLVDLLRVLRNAVTHCNGIIKSDIDKEKFREIFGEDIFEENKNYPRLSLASSLWLLRELKSIADEYSEAVLKQ